MSIVVSSISSIDEINKSDFIPIDHQLWGSNYPVKAYGRMAIIPGKEWIVELTAEETNPLRRYYNNNDPVYLDSALEVFLNFQPEDNRDRYMNFEMNANGALLAEFGTKGNRRLINDIVNGLPASCEVSFEQDRWSVLLSIPIELIRKLYSADVLSTGGNFTFGLYKISEDPQLEHYMSHMHIPVVRPDFHLPQYFAKGSVVLHK